MQCPVCQRDLEELILGRLKVDACRGGCGGIWFDNFELQMADDPQEFAGQVLLEVERDPAIQVDQAQRRQCPRCVSIVMMRHFYSEQRRVIIDTCPKCGGVWLDGGELAMIREECGAKPDKKAAAREYFSRMFREDWARTRSSE